MNHEIVSGIVNSLPIEKMVAAPLTAAINAQSQMSMGMANFIDNVGVDKDGNIRMVTFKYSEQVLTAAPEVDDTGKVTKPATYESRERNIQAPFLALTGLPNLAIEQVNISFDLEVSTAEDDKSSTTSKVESETNASYKSWWSPVSASTKLTASVTHSSEQTRHTDTRAKYSFNVTARKQPAPEAFMRLIDAIVDGVTKPTENALTDNLNEPGHGAKEKEQEK